MYHDRKLKRNSLVIVDLAMGQIPCSTERISSFQIKLYSILYHRCQLYRESKPIKQSVNVFTRDDLFTCNSISVFQKLFHH